MTEYSKGMLAKRDEVLAAHPDVRTVQQLAPLMGEHREEYLQWAMYRAPGDEYSVTSSDLRWLLAESEWHRERERSSRQAWAEEALRQQELANELLGLLDCVHDATPCRWDHNHRCQEHGFFFVPQGEGCPQYVIGEALKAAEEAREGAAVCACLPDDQAAELESAGFSRPQCSTHPNGGEQ